MTNVGQAVDHIVRYLLMSVCCCSTSNYWFECSGGQHKEGHQRLFDFILSIQRHRVNVTISHSRERMPHGATVPPPPLVPPSTY